MCMLVLGQQREQAYGLTIPILRSTVAILRFAPAFSSLLVIIFSVASTMPSLHLMPIQVPPFSTALTAYSTFKDISCHN